MRVLIAEKERNKQITRDDVHALEQWYMARHIDANGVANTAIKAWVHYEYMWHLCNNPSTHSSTHNNGCDTDSDW